jgi:hypothetical protein
MQICCSKTSQLFLINICPIGRKKEETNKQTNKQTNKPPTNQPNNQRTEEDENYAAAVLLPTGAYWLCS